MFPSLTCITTSTFGFTVSLVIVLVVIADSSVSSWFVVGLLNALLCLTVTSPFGRRPLLTLYAFSRSFGVKVRLVSLLPATFVKVWLASVNVTVAPGVTPVTVIPLFGSPPVFVT